MISSYISIICRKMSSCGTILQPPNCVRGMKVLNREKFLSSIQVPVLNVKELGLSKIILLCKPYFLKLENFKTVQSVVGEQDQNQSFEKCIHLNPETINKWFDIPEEVRSGLHEQGINELNFKNKEIQLSYENWKYETIFKAVLPENEEIVSGFSQIGHIIHLNLRDHLLEYRPLIGEVLVDKIKTCRTVVNKSNTIDNTYRNFSMEVIAGDEDYFVTVKENRCIFQFDFSKVYWNPRLGKEHERILGYLKPKDVLFDVFCGVGPFAVPAAKRKTKVFANDLNPDSFKWLNHNATNNKLNMSLFKSYNKDGKDFICDEFKDFIIKCCNGDEKLEQGAKVHVTMNLPALAVEFLQYFKGLIQYNDLFNKFNIEIIVYVYSFVVGDDPVAIAKEVVNKNMDCDMSAYILDVFDVRNVSPKKEMMRITFRLTKELLFDASGSGNEPPLKKQCLES